MSAMLSIILWTQIAHKRCFAPVEQWLGHFALWLNIGVGLGSIRMVEAPFELHSQTCDGA